MSRHLRVFRRLVRVLFPDDFRVDYESDMARTFSAQQREAATTGPRAVLRLWGETLLDLLRTAPREHAAQLRQDVAYALRMMRRTPGFTAVAVLTLATGIGATTAIFSVVNAVLVRSLPYGQPERVASLWNYWTGTPRAQLSVPELLDFRERARSVEVAAIALGSTTVSGRGDPEQLRAAFVTPNVLDVLGVRPALGRSFRPEEERRGQHTVALLTDETWRRLWDGNPAAIGQAITLNHVPHTIVGVLPAGFVMPHDYGLDEPSGLLVPLTLDASAPRNERGSHFLRSVVRLAPGFTMEQAGAEVAALARGWIAEYTGEYDHAYGATVVPIQTDIVGEVRPALLVLLGAVALVLLIACANVANLLFARGHARSREIAVRKAIGASHARLVRQVITESLVLAAAAAAAGVLLAYWLTAVIVRTAPDIPRIGDVRFDGAVLAFTIAVTMLTAVVFGSFPAVDLARRDATAHLTAERTTRSPLRQAMRGALVTAQVALALVLLTGAALLLQSFARLVRVPAGINPESVLTFRIVLPVQGYRERDRVVAFYDQLSDRLAATPGVRAVGAAMNLPLHSRIGDWDFYLPGETPGPHGSDRPADWQVVTPGYFEAIGVPLVRGRFPSRSDHAAAPAVVVINETLARRYFVGRDPIGQQIRMSGGTRAWMTIVGVSADVRHNGLDTPANPQVYLPHAQFQPFWADTTVRSLTFVARTTVEPLTLASTVRSHLRELDPHVPVSQVMTMEQVVERSVAARRVQALLLVTFAAIALLLASIGTYGVLAYQITERTREFGLRMALGANAGDIMRMVLRQGMMPAAAGVLIGLGGAALATRVLASMLFQTEPLDPVTFAATPATLLLAALLACCIPARRATRVDPSTALRSE